MKKTSFSVAITAAVISQAHAAAFVNGGFEDGNFDYWTLGGSGGGRNSIVSSGPDVNTNNQLNRVYAGAFSARVEDAASGANFSSISQRVNNYTGSNIFFAWSAVLEDPGHTAADQPSFSIILRDETTSIEIYNVSFDVSNPGAVVLKDGLDIWKYTDWQVQNLTVDSGHDFSLTVLASDCILGAHGGYAYVDGFGSVTPPTGNVPLPASVALLGIGALGLFGLRRKA